jgi:hypothetical protein
MIFMYLLLRDDGSNAHSKGVEGSKAHSKGVEGSKARRTQKEVGLENALPKG